MLTREQILEVYAAGPEAVVALVESLLRRLEALDALQRRVAELEARLAKDSHNSHQPPSSDGLARPVRTQSLREPSGRRPGAQRGHGGTTLRQSESPQEIRLHAPSACAHCGAALEGARVVRLERRQVFDLPGLALHVREHQGQSLRCLCCGGITRASFPAGVEKPVQYGPGLLGLGVYLQSYQLVPVARTRELLSVLFGHAPAAGTLKRALDVAYRSLEGVEEQIRAALQRASVVHMDETGVRVAGQTQWMHVASTSGRTLLRVHRSRGCPAVNALGVVASMQGVRVHDALPSYVSYGGRFALCNVHLLRELVSAAETTQQPWTLQMLALLRQMKAQTDRARAEGLASVPLEVRASLEQRYEVLLGEAERAHTEPPQRKGVRGGRLKRTPVQNLLRRMQRHRAAVLRFLHDLEVPFDNNQAERDLRMLKVQQKISGGFRSEEGAARFARIRGYLSTLRKQNLPILGALRDTLQGHRPPPA